MPPAARLGDIGSGHGCFPPTPAIAGSPDVFINGRPAIRVGDPYLLHGCPNCPPHPRNLSAGSPTVFINGKAAGRVGDAINCGGAAATGSPDVLIGGGSLSGPHEICMAAARSSIAAFVDMPPQDIEWWGLVPESGVPTSDQAEAIRNAAKGAQAFVDLVKTKI